MVIIGFALNYNKSIYSSSLYSVTFDRIPKFRVEPSFSRRVCET